MLTRAQHADIAHLLDAASVVIPGRLLFASLHRRVHADSEAKIFLCVDASLRYEPFYADFGPLNLGKAVTFCRMLKALLESPEAAGREVVFYTADGETARSNGAVLIGMFQILCLKRSADDAWRCLSNQKNFLPFRDASMVPHNMFEISVRHCLDAVHKVSQLGWLDVETFDLAAYEHFEAVDNGDMNIVVPGKLLAFSGPNTSSELPDGYPAFTPACFAPIFRKWNVTGVVRLNKKTYDRREFTSRGFEHLDLFFSDGSTPPASHVDRFLSFCERSAGMVAVHCKAGLGRTGTLICAYLMKHFKMTAEEAIAWTRICRPGSVIGPQQIFLKEQQARLWAEGAAHRRHRAIALPFEPEAVAAEAAPAVAPAAGPRTPRLSAHRRQRALSASVEGPDEKAPSRAHEDEKPPAAALRDDKDRDKPDVAAAANSAGPAVPTPSQPLRIKRSPRSQRGHLSSSAPTTTSAEGAPDVQADALLKIKLAHGHPHMPVAPHVIEEVQEGTKTPRRRLC